MATTVTSGKFSLKTIDFLKGLLLAVLTPVVAVVTESLNHGSLIFDWKTIGITALSAFIAYLSKNFFTPAQIIIQNASPDAVKAVDSGEAVARIVSK